MMMARMPTAIPRAIYVLSISVKPVGIGGASAPFAITLSIYKVIGNYKNISVELIAVLGELNCQLRSTNIQHFCRIPSLQRPCRTHHFSDLNRRS